MPLQVVQGAQCMCSFGTSPGALQVLPIHRMTVEGHPAANITDSQPITNIPSFGMCMSIANPQVAAATAAALGVLTPQPCIPATGTPWTPGGITVILDNMTTLDNVSTCMCMWAGVISLIDAGQTSTFVP